MICSVIAEIINMKTPLLLHSFTIWTNAANVILQISVWIQLFGRVVHITSATNSRVFYSQRVCYISVWRLHLLDCFVRCSNGAHLYMRKTGIIVWMRKNRSFLVNTEENRFSHELSDIFREFGQRIWDFMGKIWDFMDKSQFSNKSLIFLKMIRIKNGN